MVVNDGSTDRTGEILERLGERMPYLHVLDTSSLPRPTVVKDRLATAAEARAFNLGLRSVAWESFTHIAKLDGDTELPPDYFERLLGKFAHDSSLGLAGGVYADPSDRIPGGWEIVEIPNEHHVPGTLKCYSIECFRAIAGIQERLGWDTIDETYARMQGFRTRSFRALVARHHRPRASADGTLRGRARHGECAYIAHFTPSWVALRAVKMARSRPRGLSGVAFLYGYLRCYARRAPRVEDPEFRRFVHRELRERMLATLKLRGSAPSKGESGTRARPGPSASELEPSAPETDRSLVAGLER